MPRKFSISFRESASARAATKSNIAFGHFHRMAPYLKKGVSLPWRALKGVLRPTLNIKKS